MVEGYRLKVPDLPDSRLIGNEDATDLAPDSRISIECVLQRAVEQIPPRNRGGAETGWMGGGTLNL